jgi:hypothetical protein
MKKLVGFWLSLCLGISFSALSQVDTTFIYNTATPYGTLDIRIAKSATRYYYLQEGKTFSFRESAPGVKTDTYNDMTAWDSSPYMQGNLREKNGNADYFVMNYRLLLPQNYNPAYAEGYPMIVMMHGAGERGNCWDASCYWADKNWKPTTNSPAAPTTSTFALLNNDHNLLHGGEVHLNARNASLGKLPNDPTLNPRAFPGFILFAQNLNGWDATSTQDAIRIMRLVMKKYKVDQNKVYIHGLSNGGTGVYEAIKRAPWMFAGALPMSGISDAGIVSKGVQPRIANIPLWIFQGGIDTNPPPAKTETFIRSMKSAGASVRYTKYGNLGHGVWNTAYNEPDFFSWMLAKNKANIHVFADIAAVCRTNDVGARLELAEGFLAYQWEFNGAVIEGANSAVYIANEPGVYRARFSRFSTSPTEAEWNRWSDPVTVSEQNPAQAEMTQVGTVSLKGLDNYGNLQLKAVGDFDFYYWYKDGVQLTLSSTTDPKNPVFKAGSCTGLPACTGNGVYTLVTAGFDKCPSPPSAPKYVYFNNQAPVNITAPTSLSSSGSTASGATINWADASNNENGFEIWRRRVMPTNPVTYGVWTMATLTSADATTFNDSGLAPSSTYQYKIRAVADAGRSNYTPTSSSQFLVVVTQADTQAPTAPANLTASQTWLNEITLSWQGSTDNTGIREYYILSNTDTIKTGSTATTYIYDSLNVNTVFNFHVIAVDLAGNFSGQSNGATANTYMTGLYYEHSTGGWTDLDQINWNTAEFRGKVTNFTLAPRTQEDYFNFEYSGYLSIVTGGVYQFRTQSDDGSRLALNNTVIVDNDGLHGNVTVTSTNQTLTSGPKLINVKFFEYTGGQNLVVQYKGPDTGNNWVNIPDSKLTSGTPPAGGASQMIASGKSGSSSTAKEEPAFSENLKVNVFPNPLSSSQTITVQVEVQSQEPVQIRLMDMVGKHFYSGVFESHQVSEGATIAPRERLVNGMYLIIVNQGSKAVKEKVLVNE